MRAVCRRQSSCPSGEEGDPECSADPECPAGPACISGCASAQTDGARARAETMAAAANRKNRPPLAAAVMNSVSRPDSWGQLKASHGDGPPSGVPATPIMYIWECFILIAIDFCNFFISPIAKLVFRGEKIGVPCRGTVGAAAIDVDVLQRLP